jgi:DNA-binding LacI/PurR family transcriptional regulator
MAKRREVWKRREALRSALREECRTGRLNPGAPAPSVRELASKHRLSGNVVVRVLKELIDEGLLYTVPRVGTFVGRPPVELREFYLMILPDEHRLTRPEHLMQIQVGFESRIARLGCACLALPTRVALELRQEGRLPALAGLFDFGFHPDDPLHWGQTQSLPRVAILGRVEDPKSTDVVSYDDRGGGREATQHLLQLGHKRIGFLALHPREGEVGELVWSREREAGWREALTEAGLDATGLLVQPDSAGERNYQDHERTGRELAVTLLRRPDITAVVAANDPAAFGLFAAAREMNLPPAHWPAVVGFDSLPSAKGQVLSSFHLPGEELGGAAADLLWERAHGKLTGKPVHRRIAMRLIPRLTSGLDWSRTAGAVELAGGRRSPA